MKTKIIAAPKTRRETDGYSETMSVYELGGTVLVLCVNAFGGGLGLEIRNGKLSDLSRLASRKGRGADRHEIRKVTKQLHADDLAVVPSGMTPRLELMFRERVMEVLSAAGVSQHARLIYKRRTA